MDQKAWIWLCWEFQRRNKELAEAFGAEYLEYNLASLGAVRRYILSSYRTAAVILRKRPEVVFAQAPSIVLIALVAVLRRLRRFVFVIDAHNGVVDDAFLPQAWMRVLVRFAFRTADLVIVSNEALFPAARRYCGEPRALADRLPQLARGAIPQQFAGTQRPRLLLVATYAADEPIADVLEAAIGLAEPFTLFVSGKRSKAGSLLHFESERIRFTDFLPHEEFDRLLQHVELVIDVSTLENCLVCGAYEALEAGVPMLLSDSEASREVFPKGAVYAECSVDAYRAALSQCLNRLSRLKQEVQEYRPAFQLRWEAQRAALAAEIEALAAQQG